MTEAPRESVLLDAEDELLGSERQAHAHICIFTPLLSPSTVISFSQSTVKMNSAEASHLDLVIDWYLWTLDLADVHEGTVGLHTNRLDMHKL